MGGGAAKAGWTAALAACLAAWPAWGGVRAEEVTISAAEAFAELARVIYDAEPRVTHAHLTPFRAERGGPGDCDTELKNAVADALGKRQADDLTGRRVALIQGLSESVGQPGHVRIIGRYGVTDGRVWSEATVLGPGGEIAAAIPRRFLTGLVCRGRAVSLIQAAAERAAIAPDWTLTLAMRTEARVGDAVSFTLRSGMAEPTLPLCLNIAADNTAQVVTPLRRRAPALDARGALTWPNDFAGAGIEGPICFEREQNDALLCVALRNAPNRDLARLWERAWPAGAAEPRELGVDETLDLLAAAAETGGAAAMQRYRVGPRPAGARSACGRRSP